MRRHPLLGLLVALTMGVGCQRHAPDEVVVFAASSLREAFTELAPIFKAEHPGVAVRLSFAGSQDVRTQIEQGAPADVFASADVAHAEALSLAQKINSFSIFAHNEPVIVAARASAGTIASLADLPRAERLVIGASDVPIGRYTLRILDRASGADPTFRARVEARVVSRELNVRQVLAKVGLGEADAAIVYRSDAQAAGDRVVVVPIPAALNVRAEYAIAVVADAPRPDLARAWVELVRSPRGRAVLRDAGFTAP